MRASSFDKEDS